jgi:hypothetical protein
VVIWFTAAQKVLCYCFFRSGIERHSVVVIVVVRYWAKAIIDKVKTHDRSSCVAHDDTQLMTLCIIILYSESRWYTEKMKRTTEK